MASKQKQYESWGRYPRAGPTEIVRITETDKTLPHNAQRSMLAYGQGRSYGDTCLNDGGILIDTAELTTIFEFDSGSGLIRCGSGSGLAEILDLIVPQGRFLSVTPGTKYVSVGGAIAHDVHGKNHHRAGTFGCHVKRFELLRSSGERFVCSRDENNELFRATIGGLGLTGLITWAEFELRSITGRHLEIEQIPFATIEEFVSLSRNSHPSFEYTVAWFDTFPPRRKFGRGIFTRANHINVIEEHRLKSNTFSLGYIPGSQILLNDITARTLNNLYFRVCKLKAGKSVSDYDSFFFPLDTISRWNRMYGSAGVLQYQCAIPYEQVEVFQEMFSRISRSNLVAYLGVIKTFGSLKSPGMLSFPRPGVTLALDFPNRGPRLLKLLDELDEVTTNAGGAVYPAKDARLSAKSFQNYFPEWEEFTRYVDPAFSSNFWRRVSQRLVPESPLPSS